MGKQVIGNWEFLLIVAEGRGWDAEPFPELVAEGADAFKSKKVADFGDGMPLVLQQIEGLLEPSFHEVLVRGRVENLLEVR